MTRSRFQLLAAAAATAVLVTFGATRMAAQADRVTKVVVIAKPASYQGGCPTDIQFIATVWVSHHPLAIDYQWERSDHAQTPVQHLVIGSAGQGIYDKWHLGAPGQHLQVWKRLHVLAPNNVLSRPAVARITCR